MKYSWAEAMKFASDVAPHGGAWIEIGSSAFEGFLLYVAPHGGAWIEITPCPASAGQGMSPLTEGRGLKFPRKKPQEFISTSPLTEGRGLKFRAGSCLLRFCRSPLTEGRGLKSSWTRAPLIVSRSPLTEGRGLKSSLRSRRRWTRRVAPHGGAWIEICWR